MAYKRARDANVGTQQHGKRRKFDGAQSAKPQDIQRSLEQYLHHALKVLHKAVKKSRTFETQKIARKLKQAREPKEGKVDNELVGQLEAQFTALKSLSIEEIPFQILSARFSKLAFLKPHSSLLTSSLSTAFSSQFKSSSVSMEPTKKQSDPTTVQGKARNRVLANKVVKESWDECVNGFKKRIGVVDEHQEEDEQQGQKTKGITVNPDRARQIEKHASKNMDKSLSDDNDDDAELSGHEDENDVSDNELGSAIDDDEVERELARLNGGEDDDDSQGDWSESDDEDALVAGSGDESADESDKASDSSIPISPKRLRQAQEPRKLAQLDSSRANAKPTKMASSSTFLPTLAAGYISYSDSDGEDAKWIKDDERNEKKQRKNRRGQRARQAIWEKKYGSGAKHIAKQLGTSPALTKKERELQDKKKRKQEEKPFDPKTAPGGSANPNAIAVDVNKKRRRTVTYESSKSIVPVVAVKAAEAVSSAKNPPGGVSQPAKAGWQRRDIKKKEDDEGLHPSWQAKKRAQEALQLVSATAPKGKKIVFD
ncbi:hypothetical protein OIV83_000011 [Microbotryomycetes sp. JL201]|nr:hypothetical protein OIV83_000011 [Microbotryomycetes sp. JL201]